jgi:site-specific DNA recombinase
MIAAIYARKSTDQSSVADESKSVTRQVEHARAFATSQGWTVDERFIFIDDGISGAERKKLLAKERLLQQLAGGRAPFQVLVMQANDRLSRRDGDEAIGELKMIARAGVDVWFYADGSRFEWGTLEANTRAFFRAEFAAEERRKASERTREALTRKARAGHVTGGRVFGYDNVRVESHTERRINDAEAAGVRRVFELAASGIGQKRIALKLNEEGILSPKPHQGRPRSWSHSSVHEVLFRELYRGVIVWNRTRKRDSSGEVNPSNRRADEWLRVPAPHFRIVSEEMWQAAHIRIAEAREVYRHATKGLRGGRPRIESKYLLPGLARCAWCGGSIHVRTSNHGTGDRRRRVYAYACSSYQLRGPKACGNDLRISMETVDAAVLASLGKVLTADLADEVIAEVRGLMEAARASDPCEAMDEELAAIDRQIANFTDSIGMGGNLPSLVARLQQLEERRRSLVQQRAQAPVTLPIPRVDWRVMERQAREKLASWRELATRHVVEGRQLLKELIGSTPIRLTPFEEGRRRGFRFEGVAYVVGLISGLALTNGNWRPHRDSDCLAVRFNGAGYNSRRAA